LMTAERRLSIADGAFLVAAGVLAVRTYEVMLYFGPLLAVMICWCIWRATERPRIATLLHFFAACLFVGGMIVAANSLINPFSEDHLSRTAATVLDAWQNVQFDLTLLAALVIFVWAIVRPADLATRRPYLVAGFFLVLLVLSPLLVLSDTLVRPHAKSQYTARSIAGLVVATIVIVIWIYKSPLGDRIGMFKELRKPAAARRLLAFGCLMVLAVVPSDAYLTLEWRSYLQTVRTIVRTQPGVIAYESTPLSRPPLAMLVESWILPSQSLALRSKRGDGIIAPPRDFNEWQPFPPTEPYPLGLFIWRD
jgi:hypothetical protein